MASSSRFSEVEVVAVRTERNVGRAKMSTEGQYPPVLLEQARFNGKEFKISLALGSCLFVEFTGFRI